MLKLTEKDGEKEVFDVMNSDVEIQTTDGNKMSLSEFFKTVVEVIKAGAKQLKDAGLDYETVAENLKEHLATMIRNLIDFKINFFEAILEGIIIFVVNMLIDRIVKEIFEE